MSTTTAPTTATGVPGQASRRSPLWLVPAGALAGAALGAVARWWMRLITDDPEFSWSGTIFIVAAFAITGLGHGIASAARRSASRRRWSTTGRLVGAFLTLPLFTAAGAIMLPTVVGASLCRWRTDWPRSVRTLAGLLAAPAPLFLLREGWRDGLSVRIITGLLLIAATYSLIVTTTQPIVAPLGDGWRMRRPVRIALVVASALGLAATVIGITGIALAGS